MTRRAEKREGERKRRECEREHDRTCLRAVPWSATKHRHASLRTIELYLKENTEGGRVCEGRKVIIADLYTNQSSIKDTHHVQQTERRTLQRNNDKKKKQKRKNCIVTHLAHSNINFPIFSKLTICAAAASQRRPKSDSKNSFDNSSSRIIADESNLFKSATPPT